jgi:hypothetical protein
VRRSAVIGLLGLLVSAAPAAAAEPVLPDLYEETPYNLEVEQYGSGPGAVYHLGFGATVFNFGRGPLRVDGSRASTGEPEMVASQVVTNSDGSTSTYDDIGRMRYVDSVTHRHWHYLRFNTYALRTVSGKLARPDQKTGFCLGDRVIAHDWETLPGQPAEAVFNGGCGYDEPGLLSVSEGISPNYGDPYEAQVEGQFVDLTNVPAGRYQLVHHVNENRALRESDYSNNAASLLLSVEWPDGFNAAPRVRELARCDLSARCPVAPGLSRSKATSLARSAMRRYHVRATGVRCASPRGRAATCTARVGSRKATVRIAYGASRGDVFWTWSVRGRGLRSRTGRVVVPARAGKAVPTKVAGQAKVGYCPLRRV